MEIAVQPQINAIERHQCGEVIGINAKKKCETAFTSQFNYKYYSHLLSIFMINTNLFIYIYI